MVIIIFLFIILNDKESQNSNSTNNTSSRSIPLPSPPSNPSETSTSKISIKFTTSYESDEMEEVKKEYPIFDATKIPIKRYCQYKVKGKNPKTNCLKTNIVVVPKGASDDLIIQRSGLLEPYTITPYFNEPSFAQIGYAKNINIIYSPDCTMEDMKCLLSRQIDDWREEKYINSDLLEYAAVNNIYISPYASNEGGIVKLMTYLSPRNRIAFFIYVIYCYQKNINIENMYLLPDYSIFYNYVETIPNVDEIGKLIKEHPYKTANDGTVDRRNKKMAQLYDDICQYLNSLV